MTSPNQEDLGFLLTALHAIYFALAAFASATLVTLVGSAIAILLDGLWAHAMALLGLLLGFFGASGLVIGCMGLFRATRLSLVNIRDEATVIRTRSAAA